jgi:hypothetical protein
MNLKRIWLVIACAFACLSVIAQQQEAEQPEAKAFTPGSTATFTTLDGRKFIDAELVRTNSDGIVWRKDAMTGQVNFTNLEPATLVRFGLSTNSVDLARARAEQKARADAQFNAAQVAPPVAPDDSDQKESSFTGSTTPAKSSRSHTVSPADDRAKTVHVNSYTRKDGTVVRAHNRRPPSR